MNYKEKFLKIFNLFSKNKEDTSFENKNVLSPIDLENKIVVDLEENYKITKWLKNEILHNENGPALIKKNTAHCYDEEIQWYIDGKLHRDNGPAKIYQKNSMSGKEESYYQHGVLHREDGPAIITPHFEAWYINGELHREDGPAMIEKNGSGLQIWYKNGKIHCDNGLAKVEGDGLIVEYYIDGLLHREDGPARILEHGDYKEWWLNGMQFTEEKFLLHKELEEEIINTNPQVKPKKMKV